jgi:hypothetical protein
MAHRKVEQEIEALEAVRGEEPAAAAAVLRKALGDRVNLVVAKAAKLAAEQRLVEAIPDLRRAFDRLLADGAARDPQCWGKNAIARALIDLGHREAAAYLPALGCVQMEAVWGGQEDTAVTLRGIALLGLAACPDATREQIFRAIVDALAEPAHTVRLEAVRALAQMEGDEAALLLRLKARVGDSEPRVIGQVFDGLLALEGTGAFGFLASFFQSGSEAAREEAALALGASRHPEALKRLEDGWKTARDPDLRFVLLRALSASRQDEALEFLIDIACHGRRADAHDAMEALSLHRDSAEIRQRVEAAVREAGSSVQEDFRRAFA